MSRTAPSILPAAAPALAPSATADSDSRGEPDLLTRFLLAVVSPADRAAGPAPEYLPRSTIAHIAYITVRRDAGLWRDGTP